MVLRVLVAVAVAELVLVLVIIVPLEALAVMERSNISDDFTTRQLWVPLTY